MTTDKIQQLRQKVASALTNRQAATLITDRGYEVQLEARGIRIGSISTLGKVLDWIDEIVAEGK